MTAPNDNRSERDLLIKLETKFESMNDNVSKIDRKLDDFNTRLDAVVRDIKDELKNDYVSKQEFVQVVKQFEQFQVDVKSKYAPLARFEPVEEVHKDVANRLRTLLVSVGVCVLIAAASAPTWISIYKSSFGPAQVTTTTQTSGAK
jgi:hypothetical protein